jgi:hypothetical protein
VWSRLLVEFRIHSKLSATTHRPNLNPTSVTSTDQVHLTQTGAALGPLPTKSITIWTPLPVCPYYFPAFVYLALKHAKKQTSSANHQTLINRQTKMRPTINALLRVGLSRLLVPRPTSRGTTVLERRTAKRPWQKLSETLDVFFSTVLVELSMIGFPSGSCLPLLPLAMPYYTRIC